MILKSRKFNNRKKGQALLIVIVISTLTLLVLVSMADRILLARVNVQRSAEFDRSIAVAENKLNELIRFIDTNEAAACLGNLVKDNYKELTNCDILNNSGNNSTNNLGSTKVYGRISSNGYVSVDANNPLTLILSESLDQGVPTSGIVARCTDGNNNVRFLITRVYLDGDSLFVDKGIYDCSSTSSPNVCRGNVDLYSTRSGSAVKVAGNGSEQVTRQNTILVGARLLNEINPNVKLEINVYGPSGSSPSNCDMVAATSKYEFIVAGLGGVNLSNGSGGLGSDVLYYFEKPRGNTTTSSPSIFDYVLLSEDL